MNLADYIRFLDHDLSTGRSLRVYFSAAKTSFCAKSRQLAESSSIRELLTATAHNKPSLPIIPGEIWDADKMIHLFVNMPENRRLSNIELSAKCIVLLMLASGRQKIDIMSLDIAPQFMKKTKDTFFCAMSKPAKGNRNECNNFMQYIEFHRFRPEPKICPYTVLEDYIRYVRNTTGKNAAKHTALFVSTQSGTPAHRDTGRRWAKQLLEKAGITEYNIHSIRSASSSKAAQYKEPIENIMARCAWKRQSTFFTHYLRPVALGVKPTALGPLSTETLCSFYCPPKLLFPGSKVVPPPENYVLGSEVFMDITTTLPDENEVDFIPICDQIFPPAESEDLPLCEERLPVNPSEQITFNSVTCPMSPNAVENLKIDMAERMGSSATRNRTIDRAEEQQLIDLTDQHTDRREHNSRTSGAEEEDPQVMELPPIKVPPLATPQVTLKTTSGTYVISPVSTSTPHISPKPSKTSPYMTLHNRILRRNQITRLPPAVRQFKRRKAQTRKFRPIAPAPVSPHGPPATAEKSTPREPTLLQGTPAHQGSRPFGKASGPSALFTATQTPVLPQPPAQLPVSFKMPPVSVSESPAVTNPVVPISCVSTSHGNIQVTLSKGVAPPPNAVVRTKTFADTHPQIHQLLTGTSSVPGNVGCTEVASGVHRKQPSPCAKTVRPGDAPMPQLAFFMEATSTGHSEIKYLFPEINLDRKVLFGQNYNYQFPVSRQFPLDSLVSHFVCTKISPLELGIIVPCNFPVPEWQDCVAITINDAPFKARLVDFNQLRSCLYTRFVDTSVWSQPAGLRF